MPAGWKMDRGYFVLGLPRINPADSSIGPNRGNEDLRGNCGLDVERRKSGQNTSVRDPGAGPDVSPSRANEIFASHPWFTRRREVGRLPNNLAQTRRHGAGGLLMEAMGPMRPAEDANARLSLLAPDNRMEQPVFILCICAFAWESWCAGRWLSAADTLVAKTPMPILHWQQVVTNHFKPESMTANFPQLAARGLLIVTDERHLNAHIA
ncbi:hypothetical protein FB451DRAFT_1167824 [Mycena latifolia]|nr:hypothetical protein FB451DRAFT_1167824 [Mycena latifolia]